MIKATTKMKKIKTNLLKLSNILHILLGRIFLKKIFSKSDLKQNKIKKIILNILGQIL